MQDIYSVNDGSESESESKVKVTQASLTINPVNCAFANPEVEYLGFVIGGEQVKPQAWKLPLPETWNELRCIIGVDDFHHRFIPNFYARAASLTDMMVPLSQRTAVDRSSE